MTATAADFKAQSLDVPGGNVYYEVRVWAPCAAHDAGPGVGSAIRLRPSGSDAPPFA